MPLEVPQLQLPYHKTNPTQWMWKASGCDDNSQVGALAMKGAALFAPSTADIHSWAWMTKGEIATGLPQSFYDTVFLTNVLEHYNTDDRRSLIIECGTLLKPGGKIVSVSVACDDAQEVFDLMEPTGVDVASFVAERLTNKDIARMRPTEAVFLRGLDVIPTRKRLVTYIRDLNLECELNHLWKAGERFAVNRLSVGMVWQAM